MTDRTAQQLRVFDLATGKEIAQKEIQKEVQTLGHDEVGNIILGNWMFSTTKQPEKTTFTLISADLTKEVTTNEQSVAVATF